jgi:catechol 2,3-dioxygenase-like lactoylglutathione lyase family enzyme
MFGRFLELAITTRDIAAAVAFYEQLGFTQLITGDALRHRYGVLSDGRLSLGLHEQERPSPSLCFVLPGLASARAAFELAGFEPELVELGEHALHELRLRDPCGHVITLLEARTYSPAAAGAAGDSQLGYFCHLSLPETDFEAARSFWERGGFVALPELDEPYPHLPLTSDGIDLAFHARRVCAQPMLVFECPQLAARVARLREQGIALQPELPRGLAPGRAALIETPEGLLLLLIGADG